MWIALALLTALLAGVQEGFVKVAARRVDEFTLAASLGLGTAALLLPVVLLVGGGVADAGAFWLALGVSGSLNAVASVLIARAVMRSDLSLVSPLKSFTPLFMVPISALVLAEVPSWTGLLGIATIVAGSYALNLSRRASGLLAPLRALLADPGARLMLVVAFLYSITATFDKVGVEASTPLVWALALNGCYGLLVLPLALRWGRGGWAAEGWRGGGRFLALAVVMTAAVSVTQMTAITLTLAAYLIAIKRMSIVVAVLIGGLALREAELPGRLTGALVMLAGFALVTLS